MKLFTAILFSVFFSGICLSQTKNNLKTAVLLYSTSSRGLYKSITVENKVATVSETIGDLGLEEEIAISNKDWSELNNYFKTIDLDSLVALKAPTEKRLYDGAFVAHLKIFYKDKIFETQAFDHGFPPKEIKKLVDKINILAKTE
jgi:hypothetical protein